MTLGSGIEPRPHCWEASALTTATPLRPLEIVGCFHLFSLLFPCLLHPVVIDCGDPGTPANGERAGSEFTYAKTVTYDCDPGYQISGSRSRFCQLDGSWTGSVATCVGEFFSGVR